MGGLTQAPCSAIGTAGVFHSPSIAIEIASLGNEKPLPDCIGKGLVPFDRRSTNFLVDDLKNILNY